MILRNHTECFMYTLVGTHSYKECGMPWMRTIVCISADIWRENT